MFVGKRLLVCAVEAGAGAYLAALLRENSRYREAVIYAYPKARAAFSEGRPLRASRIARPDGVDAGELLDRIRPDVVVLGASASASQGTTRGWSLEKMLLLEARRRGVRVVVYVDHYWNLWQRFAHPRTARRWFFIPDKIYVLNRKLRDRMIQLGCPASRVGVKAHPGLETLLRSRAILSSAEVRKSLGIEGRVRIALFVSENEFTRSTKWRWEQPTRKDLKILLTRLLEAAEASRGRWVVVVKLHPADEEDKWGAVLGRFAPSFYRIVRNFDRPSLLDSTELVFGLNSMLLLEALQRRRKVYSMHQVKKGRGQWLSSLEPRVRELKDGRKLARLLQGFRGRA